MPCYFPPLEGDWELLDSEEQGWNAEKLQAAFDFAKKHRTTGLVILYRGRILAEQHFEVTGARAAKFERPRNATAEGHSVEDVASVQKSVASILVGVAQEKDLLKFGDPVSRHLGDGWSKASPERERAISIRHLLTMTSGLTVELEYQDPPDVDWKYNTTAYAKVMEVVEVASGMERNELTSLWLTKPLGMADSKWVRRRAGDPQGGNHWGFSTSARDLARFGLMVLNKGSWDGKSVLGDIDYLALATTSSQNLNPHYGYLFWVNRNAFARPEVLKNPRAPGDMVQASGALNRRCFIVPSLDLVVTRLGDQPESKAFDQQLWRLISAAMP